jgi:hypothetical protein
MSDWGGTPDGAITTPFHFPVLQTGLTGNALFHLRPEKGKEN